METLTFQISGLCIEDEPCHKPQIDPQIHIMKVGEDSSEKRLAWVKAKTKSLADCF